MAKNKQKNDKKERMTVFITPAIKEWIDRRATKERRKPAAMAAIILEDAQAADKGLF